jgi:hypothetical protein
MIKVSIQGSMGGSGGTSIPTRDAKLVDAWFAGNRQAVEANTFFFPTLTATSGTVTATSGTYSSRGGSNDEGHAPA